MKKFFRKIGDYIKNTAWIQPLLIVVVIFLVLFLLNPITTGIKNLWNLITTRNNMETVSYKEYVETIKDSANAYEVYYNDHDGDMTDYKDQKYIVVFTQKNCEHCDEMYDLMNTYLKSSYNNGDFKILNVKLTTKTSKGELVYKDKTMGKADGSVDDYVKLLDQRIEDFATDAEGYNSSDFSTVTDSVYTYVSTPMFIWYVNGMEVRISNNFDSQVSSTTSGDKSYTSFVDYMKFPTTPVVGWDSEFNLTYKG